MRKVYWRWRWFVMIPSTDLCKQGVRWWRRVREWGERCVGRVKGVLAMAVIGGEPEH